MIQELDFDCWPIDGGKRVAVTFEVNFEGWTSQSAPDKPMPPLKPGTVDLYGQSYAEYAYRSGLPRLLAIFRKYDQQVTIMTSGMLAEKCPGLLREAGTSGHEIGGHGYAQDLISAYLSAEDEIAQMEATNSAIEAATGVAPVGWRSPRSTSSERTNALLADREFLWHGNSDRGDLPIIESYGERKIVAIQRPNWINDLIMCVSRGAPARDLVEAFDDVLDYCLNTNEPKAQVISVAVHAHLFGRPYGAWALDKILGKAKSHADVWTPRVMDIAEVALKSVAQER